MYTIYKETVGGLSPLTDLTLLEKVKKKFISGPVNAKIYVPTLDLTLTNHDYIKDFTLSELRFVPDKGIFGGAVAKKVEVNFNNFNKSIILENEEFELSISVEYEEETYIIKYGTYIVQKPETEDTTDNTNIIALDYMVKFNKIYEDTIIYPCTLKELAENLCSQIGINLADETFRNEDFEIENNQFVNGESCRELIQGIAMSAFSWARIDEDNKLHFDFTQKNSYDIELTQDDYFSLNNKDLIYGPINKIIIRESEIEGENVVIEDEDSIEIYGENELVIIDNPFAYTQSKREELIEAGRELFGLSYMPINSVSLIGYVFLDCKTKISFTNLQETTFETYLFNHIINYNGACLDTIETPALTKTETKYQYTPKLEQSVKRTEIIVDKANQQITTVVAEIGDRSSKTTTITQDISNLESAISEIADITVSGESYSANISGLENINESEPIHIDIHPINENISYLYPSTGLFPTDTLFPKIRKLRFINTRENTYIDYELPDDLLYYDENNYDTFTLDYEGQICRVIKKCKYNADGTVELLTVPTTTDYPYPTLNLTEGDYDVYLPGYGIGYIFVRLMAKNMYTTQFATRVEMNSAIHQSSTEIMTEVNKKVDENEFGTKITQNYESVQIAWNNISQLIQFMLINNIPSLAFKTDNNGMLMALDKDGQHFYDGSNNVFAEMGVQTVDNQKYLAFSIPGQWNSNLRNGMAWGMKINNQFYPILFIKDFYTGSQQSDVWGGKLVLNACDLVLQGVETGIETGNIKMYGNALNGLNFEDTQNNDTLLSIIPSLPNGEEYINFLNGSIEFYKNQLGTHTFRIGNILITDDNTMFIGNSNSNNGYFNLNGNGDVYGYFNIHGNFDVSNGNTYLDNLYVSGTKNRVVEVDNGDKILLNAYETTTPYFGDIGSNKTDSKGQCKIEIDKLFSQTIEKDDYKVFIQECGEGHLYVEKHKDYFIVKGTPNIDFDWEIKAIQKGYKNTRLEKLEKEEK